LGRLGFFSNAQVIKRLFAEGKRRSFEIRENGGPTLFTESFDHGTLGCSPGRHEFLNLFSAFGGDGEFHPIAAPAALCRYQTIPLQWLKIPHECRALQPKAIA